MAQGSSSTGAAAVITGLAASAVAKKVADGVWKAGSQGKEPPKDPTDPNPNIGEVLLYAVVSGAIISVVRVLISRRVARKERARAHVDQAMGRA